MKIDSCDLTCSWPMYSDSARGRIARSTASSGAPAAALDQPFVLERAHSRARALQRPANQLLGGQAGLAVPTPLSSPVASTGL